MLEVFTQFQFDFLHCLSVVAFFTTVGLFFCGIPICRQIWKRKDTNEIAGAPFLMGVLGGTCWLTYGYLKGDDTVMIVTSTQVVLYSSYVVFYWFMSKKKFWITIKIIALVTVCASLIASVYFFGHKVFHPLGIVCMTLNTADFGAPLAGLKVVLRRRATSTLPLPLCIANFLVSSEWFIYGLLVHDFYLITPNGIGSVLAVSQLLLFIVLPRKPGQRSPILRLFYAIRSIGIDSNRVKDIESDAVVPVEQDEDCKIAKHRWSDRIVANVANVTGEIENVIHKVHLGDPFAYSPTLNKSTTSSESGSPETAHTPVEHKEMQFPTVYPVTIINEEQLLEVARKIAAEHMQKEHELETAKSIEAAKKAEKLKRCISEPDLSKN